MMNLATHSFQFNLKLYTLAIQSISMQPFNTSIGFSMNVCSKLNVSQSADILASYSGVDWLNTEAMHGHFVVFPSLVQKCFPFDLTDLREGKDQECSSATGLYNDCQELWVDSTEGTIPCHLGNADVVVTLLSLHRLAKDMPKLTLPYDAATHGWRTVGGEGGTRGGKMLGKQCEREESREKDKTIISNIHYKLLQHHITQNHQHTAPSTVTYILYIYVGQVCCDLFGFESYCNISPVDLC